MLNTALVATCIAGYTACKLLLEVVHNRCMTSMLARLGTRMLWCAYSRLLHCAGWCMGTGASHVFVILSPDLLGMCAV